MPPAVRRHARTPSTANGPAPVGFSPVKRALALAVVALLAIRNAPACEVSAPRNAGSSVETTAAAPCDLTTALGAYAARAATLRERALRMGTITYQDVAETAYAPGTIDRGLLQTKAHWRATLGHGFVFITDYATLRDAALVQTLVAVPDPRLQSTLVAQYESTSHLIGLAPVATDFAIFHEAGHALQRASLQTRGVAAGRRTEAPEFPVGRELRPGTADATTVRRLQYLCSQDEFEVRLQDLNRFHALLVAGRPIMDPLDSVRALAALGIPLTYEETHDAFALAGRRLSRKSFDQHHVAAPLEPAMLAVAFEDARELCLVRRLTMQIDPACWPRLLAKIIFEAPGHL